MAVFFAHISDLHFGTLAPRRAEQLTSIINARAPQFCIVSGDITMRARKLEYLLAKNFLQTLTVPLYVVPGNHDIPLLQFWERFLTPFQKFEEHIGPTQLIVNSSEYRIIGINSASPWTIKNGRIRSRDLASIEAATKNTSDNKLSIVVSHHPLPWILKRLQLMRLYPQTIDRLLACPVDLYLCGHYHLSRHSFTKDWFSNRTEFQSLFFQAGTALSSRLRGENNSFYFYHYDDFSLTVNQWLWNESANDFLPLPDMHFSKDEHGWHDVS